MLYASMIFFAMAVVSGFISFTNGATAGFTGGAGGIVVVSQIIFWLALVLFVITMVGGVMRHGPHLR